LTEKFRPESKIESKKSIDKLIWFSIRQKNRKNFRPISVAGAAKKN
jgi:hypothetical protein